MEIQSNSPNECWYIAMRHLLEKGKDGVMYQRDCICADNITYVIENFTQEEMPAECLLNKLFSRDYPTRYKFENGGIEIKRIYSHGESKVNQFALAQEVLEHGDVFSRAMIVVAKPDEDAGINGAPKCLTYIHYYLDSESKVSCICSYSVSNMAQFNVLDIYLLHNIHKDISSRLGMNMGTLIIHFDRVFLWKPDAIIYQNIFSEKNNEKK